MKAILLAGGKGTRLRPLTVHTPKPIVPIFNRPFLYYQIDQLRQVPGIDEVILSLITCNTINAGIYVLEPDTFDRIPKDTAWSIERSYFPSLIERGETFVAYVDHGYWIDIGTPAKYLQVHRDIMDGRYAAPPFAGLERDAPWIAIFPGGAIMLTVFAINMFGDGLRDALDARLRIQ